MQPTDLLILTLACYLLTDYLVNRALPFGVMTRIRAYWQTDALHCFYCAAIWSGIAVYLLWRVEPQLIYPPAAGGAAILLWRYTGGNHA